MSKKSTEKLSPLELEIMQVFWRLDSASIREIQEALPKKKQVEYTTVQTIVYRFGEEEGGTTHEEDRECAYL